MHNSVGGLLVLPDDKCAVHCFYLKHKNIAINSSTLTISCDSFGHMY
jgi:hypothetical protein